MKKAIGWLSYIIGMIIIWCITEGFWIPFVAIMLIVVGIAMVDD